MIKVAIDHFVQSAITAYRNEPCGAGFQRVARSLGSFARACRDKLIKVQPCGSYFLSFIAPDSQSRAPRRRWVDDKQGVSQL